MNFLIILAVAGAVAYRVIAPDDRARYLALGLAQLRALKTAFTTPRPEIETFDDALCGRTPLVVIAPALVVLNVVLIIAMVFGRGSLSDASTLVGWGANIGTRTTNGEWWRLATSTLVHSGVVVAALQAFALAYAGVLAERLHGRAAFAVVYFSAGVLAGLVQISLYPVTAATGAAAAISGVYGLLTASVLWQRVRARFGGAPPDEVEPPPVVIPQIVARRLAVVGAVVGVCSLLAGDIGRAELFGFLVGFGCGAAVGRRADREAASNPTVSVMAAAMAITALVLAVPLRGIDDVKPDIDRVMAAETRTSAAFADAFDRFRRGRISGDALAQLADATIVPELRAIDARLGGLRHVPAEHVQIVADAREFLRLRIESWTARADAVRRTQKDLKAAASGVGGSAAWRVQAERRFRATYAAAGKAESAERDAADALLRVKNGYSCLPIAD